MKKFKCILAITLVFVFAFSLIGCGGIIQNDSKQAASVEKKDAAPADNKKEEAAKEGPKDGKKFTIGVSLPAPDNQWVAAVIENAKTEGEKEKDKYDVVITTANNPAKQVSDVEDLMARKADVMVLFPLESAPLTPVAEKVRAQNIPLVVLTRGISSENYTTFIHGSDRLIGINAAHYIGKRLNGKGKVVEMQALPSEITTMRSNGFYETIKKYYPGIEVIAKGNGGFAREPALKEMENILQANKHIDAVYSHDDEQSLGIIAAIKAAGRDGEMFVTGAGGNKGAYELMMKGDKNMAVSFSYSPLQGGSAVKLAKLLCQKKGMSDLWEKSIPKEIILDSDAVTAENVKQYYDPNSKY